MVCSDIVQYGGDLPPIGIIVLEGTPPVAKTCSAQKSAAFKSKPPQPK